MKKTESRESREMLQLWKFYGKLAQKNVWSVYKMHIHI